METQQKRKSWINWMIFLSSIVVVFALGMLASTISERRVETEYVYKPKVYLSQWEPRNNLWGKNFPAEYDSYMKTSESSFRSKYNGNTMIDMLEVDPRLVVLWAGYSFSKDYNQGRGHYYAIDDMHNTLRVGAPGITTSEPMPATCWTCKSPDVPRLMNKVGITEFYSGAWSKWGTEIVNPIGCADCHDNESMDLHISRPALIEAFKRQKKDITKATHQEMRSLVCAQCHVEYYFNKHLPGKEGVSYLTFPWDKGMNVENMIDYYDEMNFSDWTHKISKAPMLKAQHPGYETWITGTHAKRGVTCADCHMPYMSEGGQKFTDHHKQSPLNNIANSCQVCHRESEEALRGFVYDKMDKVIEQRDKLEIMLVQAHAEAGSAWENGASDEQMKSILQDIRHAQFRWDYAAASHGAAFHNSLEILRVISTGMEDAQDARVKLAVLLTRLNAPYPVAYPDIETKAKAQKYIELPMEQLIDEKQQFLDKIIPAWIKEAHTRESLMEVKY